MSTSSSPGQLLQRWFSEVWNEGRRELIGELFCPKAGKAYGLSPEPAGQAEFFVIYDLYQTLFDDLHFEVSNVIESGDGASAVLGVRATHSATGKQVDFSGMVSMRAEGGKLTEGWNCFDFLTLAMQLSDLPADSLSRALAGQALVGAAPDADAEH